MHFIWITLYFYFEYSLSRSLSLSHYYFARWSRVAWLLLSYYQFISHCRNSHRWKLYLMLCDECKWHRDCSSLKIDRPNVGIKSFPFNIWLNQLPFHRMSHIYTFIRFVYGPYFCFRCYNTWILSAENFRLNFNWIIFELTSKLPNSTTDNHRRSAWFKFNVKYFAFWKKETRERKKPFGIRRRHDSQSLGVLLILWL